MATNFTKTKRAFAHSGVVSIAIMGLALVTGILAARLLGPEGRGYLGAIVFWSGFLAVFGRPPAADVLVVEAGDSDSPRVSPTILKHMFKIVRLALLLFLPIYLSVIWLYFSRYPDEIRLIAIGFAAVQAFCSFQSQVYEGAFRANQAFTLLFLFRLSVPALYILCLLVSFVFFEPSILTFAAAHACAMLLSLFFRLFVTGFADATDGEPASTKEPSRELWPMLLTFYGTTVFSFLTLHVDKAMVMLTQSIEQVGIYLVALALAFPAQGLLGYALNAVGLPTLVKVPQHKREGAYLRLLRLTLFAAVSQSAAIAIIAPFAIPILFGTDFAAAGPMASAIALATLPMPLRRAFSEIFRSKRQANVITRVEAIYMATFVATFLLTTQLDVPWPFVPAFAVSNAAAVILLWTSLRRMHPEMRLSHWALPRVETVKEFIDLSRSAIARAGKS